MADPTRTVSFEPRTGEANPVGDLTGLGVTGTTFADLDRDGDLDALVFSDYTVVFEGAVAEGEADFFSGTVRYFENTGTKVAPTFAQQPLPGDVISDDLGAYPVAAAADIDADGDMDILQGDANGNLNLIDNTGTATVPFLDFRVGLSNPFHPIRITGGCAPALGDLDRDGDLDFVLIPRTEGSHPRYFENIGSATTPELTEMAGTHNPLESITLGAWSAGSLVDIDVDGDLDLLLTDAAGAFRFIENIGDALTPRFHECHGSHNPFGALNLESDTGLGAVPAFSDLDGDTDLDLAVGQIDGGFAYFENTGTKRRFEFIKQIGADSPLQEIEVGSRYSIPVVADIDADGDIDLFALVENEPIVFLENIGTARAPDFEQRIGSSNPMPTITQTYANGFALGDIDADGDLDVLVKDSGSFLLYENTGRADSPTFATVSESLPFGSSPYPNLYGSIPLLLDIDGDGDLDAAFQDYDYPYGYIGFFENVGDAVTPSFEIRRGETNPLASVVTSFNVGPSSIDLDGDGDLDIIVGEPYAGVRYFENVGNAIAPSLEARTKRDSLFFQQYFYFSAFTDLNGDAGLDYLADGSRDDEFDYFVSVVQSLNALEGERDGEGNPEGTPSEEGESVPEGEGEFAGPAPFCTIALDSSGVNPPASGDALGQASLFLDPMGGVGIRIEHNMDRPARIVFQPDGDGEEYQVACLDYASPIVATIPASIFKRIREDHTLRMLSADGPDADIGGAANCAAFFEVFPEAAHSADHNLDSRINLSEILRLIQFFNSDGFSCASPPSSTEDGYQPGPGDTTCAPHSSDYAPQDFMIALGELLRAIQFYNLAGYFYCPEADPPTEDGFCPRTP